MNKNLDGGWFLDISINIIGAVGSSEDVAA